MTRHSLLGTGAIAIALMSVPASAAEKKPEPLAIKLSAAYAPAESDVLVRMRVEPDARARELILEWVSDDLSGGSHLVTLEGALAPATHSYAIKRISEGQYRVTAILRLNDGSEIRRAAVVTVVGTGTAVRVGSGIVQGSAGGKWPATRK
jgi:hypothetical protein